MKKYLILLCFICLLTACSKESEADWPPSTFKTVNNLEGVTISVKQSSVSSTGLTIVMSNRTDRSFSYGEFFSLDKKVNDNWVEVPVIGSGFDDPALHLNAKHTKEWDINWEWLYGELTKGDYRIIKEVFDSYEATGIYEVYPLAAEFVVE